MPSFFTSTPRNDTQNVPTIPQAQANSPNQLISNSVPQYQPPSISADVQDQFHHQSNPHDATVQDFNDSTISLNSQPDTQPPPKVTVQFTDATCDTMKDLKKKPSATQQEIGSRAILNSMCILLDKFPTNNSFAECRHFTSDDPPRPMYTLSSNHQTFLNGLLHQLNDHMPPSNLALMLAPFISYDINLGRYRATDSLLTLDIIQKLDHLINSSNGPITFQRIKDKIAHHTRSSSK